MCSVAYRLLDGTEFIGRGIAPDAECEISTDDLRAGTDSVLREALRRLREFWRPKRAWTAEEYRQKWAGWIRN